MLASLINYFLYVIVDCLAMEMIDGSLLNSMLTFSSSNIFTELETSSLLSKASWVLLTIHPYRCREFWLCKLTCIKEESLALRTP